MVIDPATALAGAFAAGVGVGALVVIVFIVLCEAAIRADLVKCERTDA